jgi:glycosyltransferase involved in cell wall biosynthesis
VLAALDDSVVARMAVMANDADAIVLLDDHAGAYALLGLGDDPDVPVVVDKHVVLGRPLPSEDASPRLRHPRIRLLRHLLLSYEKRYVSQSAAVVVTSPEDGHWLERLYGLTPTAVVPSAVDLPTLPPCRPVDGPIAWIGSLDAEENVDGLSKFVEGGWLPLAWRGAELWVAGRAANQAALSLAEAPGVRMLGHVQSVDNVLGRAAAAVVPLWAGRGVKLKTLTLLAAGLPVVSTPVGIEGLDVENGRHCLVADTPEGLAGHLEAVLTDADLADSLGREGRRLVADRYTWDVVGPQFCGVVHGCLAGKATAQ